MAVSHVRFAADGQAVTGSECIYYGCSVAEADGTPAVATVKIFAGTAATAANLIEIIELAANGSIAINRSQGILCKDGIFVDVIAGTVEGVVFHG